MADGLATDVEPLANLDRLRQRVSEARLPSIVLSDAAVESWIRREMGGMIDVLAVAGRAGRHSIRI
jgi:hypothetical protein